MRVSEGESRRGSGREVERERETGAMPCGACGGPATSRAPRLGYAKGLPHAALRGGLDFMLLAVDDDIMRLVSIMMLSSSSQN